MKKIHLMLALLTLGITGIKAQEIEVPEDAPRETWQLVYDDYRRLYWGNTPEYTNLAMDVTVVHGENCLYVQGIAKSCPDSWIKIGDTDDFLHNELLMWSNQPVTVAGSTQYFNVGTFNLRWDPHNTFATLLMYCNGSNIPLVFNRDFSSNHLEYVTDRYSAFWVKNKPNDGFSYYYTQFYDNPTPPDDTIFPADEIYLSPRLIYKTSSIVGINTADDETDAPVYTPTGIMVDRNNLTPGVYVSRGKKFVVK